jgi:O-antigen/teichoic acid export membrane protein
MALKKLIYQAFIWKSLNYLSVFLLNIVTARLLGASESGEIYYVITFFSLLVLFASLNLESSFAYFSLSKEIGINALVSVAIFWIVFFSAIFFFFFRFVQPAIPLPEQMQFRAYSLLFVIGMLLSTYYTSLFYGQKSFSYPNIISFVANFSILIFLLYGNISRVEISSLMYIRLYFIVSFLQGLVIVVFFHSKHVSKFAFRLLSFFQLKKILRYSAFTFITSIFLFLLYRVDYWLLLNLNPSPKAKAELGNYIQVSKLIFSFQIISSIIGSGIFSGTVSNNVIGKDKTLGMIIRCFFYIGFFAFLLLIVFGKSLFTWIYGETFDLMYRCFLLILPGSILLMTASVTANYLSGLGKVNYNLFGVSISLALIITLDLIFIPEYGIFAAAAVSGISYFVYGVFMLFQFSRHYDAGWKSIFNYKNDIALLRAFLSKTKQA